MHRVCAALSALVLASLVAAADEADKIPAEVRKPVVEAVVKSAERRAEAAKKEAAKAELLTHAKAGVVDAKVKKVTIPDSPDKDNPVRFPTAASKKQYLASLEEELKKIPEVAKLPAAEPGTSSRRSSTSSPALLGRSDRSRTWSR